MKPYNDETKALYDEAFRLLRRTIEILDAVNMGHCEATGVSPDDTMKDIQPHD